MTANTGRTPLAGRNRIACDECGDVMEGREELKRTIQWGFWDADAQNFERETHQEHYCAACWREEFQREAAAYYEVEDSDRLWDILAAADGRLVADLAALFVGSKPWVRVVDGELQALRTTREVRQEGDQPVVSFGVEEVDVDREWFVDVVGAHDDLPDDEYPNLVKLKPADETPFRDWDKLPDGQHTFADLQGRSDAE